MLSTGDELLHARLVGLPHFRFVGLRHPHGVGVETQRFEGTALPRLDHFFAAQAVGSYANVPVVDAHAVARFVHVGGLEHFVMAGEYGGDIVLFEKRLEVAHGHTRLAVVELVPHRGAVHAVGVGHVVVLHDDDLALGASISQLFLEPAVLIRTGHKAGLVHRIGGRIRAPPAGRHRLGEVPGVFLVRENALGISPELSGGNAFVIAFDLGFFGHLIRCLIGAVSRIEADNGYRPHIGAVVGIASIRVIRAVGIKNLVVGGARPRYRGAIIRAAVAVHFVVAQRGDNRNRIEELAFITGEVAEPFIPVALGGGAFGDIAGQQHQVRFSGGNGGVIDFLRLILGEHVIDGVLAVTGGATEFLIPGRVLPRAFFGALGQVEGLFPFAVGHAPDGISFGIREGNDVERIGDPSLSIGEGTERGGMRVAVHRDRVGVGGAWLELFHALAVLVGMIGANPGALRYR